MSEVDQRKIPFNNSEMAVELVDKVGKYGAPKGKISRTKYPQVDRIQVIGSNMYIPDIALSKYLCLKWHYSCYHSKVQSFFRSCFFAETFYFVNQLLRLIL